MLDAWNPCVPVYRAMRDVLEANGRPEVHMAIQSDKDHDVRRYNKPRTFEPSILFAGTDGNLIGHRDIA
eukprot:8616546-Pyramimonas_sp.AAC.1